VSGGGRPQCAGGAGGIARPRPAPPGAARGRTRGPRARDRPARALTPRPHTRPLSPCSCALEGLLAGGLAPSQLVAVSRNPSGAAAAAVAARGVEVAAADLDDPSSLKPLLAGARFVYCHALSGDAASADPAEVARGRALAELLRERQAGGGGAGGPGPLGLVAYNSTAGRGANAGISQVRAAAAGAEGRRGLGPGHWRCHAGLHALPPGAFPAAPRPWPLHPPPPRPASPRPHQMDQKHEVADILMASGAPFLGLEATMFMEEFWKKYTRPQIVGKATFPFSLPGAAPPAGAGAGGRGEVERPPPPGVLRTLSPHPQPDHRPLPPVRQATARCSSCRRATSASPRRSRSATPRPSPAATSRWRATR
jgi:hypothetical protein